MLNDEIMLYSFIVYKNIFLKKCRNFNFKVKKNYIIEKREIIK